MVVKTIAIFNVSVIFICVRARERKKRQHRNRSTRNYTSIKRKTVKHVIGGFFKTGSSAVPNSTTLCKIASLKANKFKLVCLHTNVLKNFSCHFFQIRIQKNHLNWVFILFCHPVLAVLNYDSRNVSNKTSTVCMNTEYTLLLCASFHSLASILYARFAPNWIIYNLNVKCAFYMLL